ncbi:MAG: ATP-binding protein [Leptolyngbyaceae cyanobacterium SU_3_3]|nr:ATP-binding protein [Leptolyngbyaceae cyanobacterium SU_3_3]
MQFLTVPGVLDSLDEIAKFCDSGHAGGWARQKAAYRFRLAVDEIATNIIVHGYEETANEGDVTLQVELNEHTLTLILEDTAISYNPNQHDLPDQEDLNEPLEKRKIGGLGVYLAIQGVDKFMYERVGNRNRNIFVVNRPTD